MSAEREIESRVKRECEMGREGEERERAIKRKIEREREHGVHFQYRRRNSAALP